VAAARAVGFRRKNRLERWKTLPDPKLGGTPACGPASRFAISIRGRPGSSPRSCA
jgi:hypothetical protein